ncbi:MAG: acyl-CoA dehydrogenase family protein, partial [Cumulibacter sp.]
MLPNDDFLAGGLTEEQRELQLLAREFTMREVLPVANELDPVEGMIPMSLREKMAEVGFFGIMVPEEYGGLGLGALEYCIVAEELARGWMSVASILARGQSVPVGLPEDQRKKYLEMTVRGEFLGATAISEPEAGSDVANISCRATKSGDEWVINGTKMWCTFADGADYLQVFARTSPASDPRRRHEGVSAFFIPKVRGTFPEGISGTKVRKIGYRGCSTLELSFDNFVVPAEALVGEEGKAFRTIMTFLDTARAHTAARSIGLARGAMEDSVDYLKTRVVFGEPIETFQALRFMVADMATKIEVSRQLMYAGWREIDAGRRAR